MEARMEGADDQGTGGATEGGKGEGGEEEFVVEVAKQGRHGMCENAVPMGDGDRGRRRRGECEEQQTRSRGAVEEQRLHGLATDPSSRAHPWWKYPVGTRIWGFNGIVL